MTRTVPVQKPGKSIQEVETPDDFIRAVEGRFGQLTYDLAAEPHNAKANMFISPEADSLKCKWPPDAGTKWLKSSV